MSLSSFNGELLNDRLGEYHSSLERTVEQHRLLAGKLHSLQTRFQRATEHGQQTFTRKYTMQMSSVSGTMCMYEEHIKRKIAQIRKLKVLQQRIEKTKTSSATNEIQSGGTKVLDQTTSKHTSSDVGSTQNGRTDIDAKGSSNSSCVSTYVEEPFPRESQKRRHSSADIDMDTNSEVEEELSLRKSFRVGS